MKRLLSHVCLALLLLVAAAPVAAELVVIVNPQNPVTSLTKDQVVDLYMGRQTNFPGGDNALPIDLPVESPQRAEFYRKLVGKSIAQVNAYWARLLFTGRATPPRIMKAGPAAVLKSVRENRDAIAYLGSEDVDGKVRVVYRMK